MWCHAGYTFEKLTEKARIGEIQILCYLCNRNILILQHYLCIGNQRTVNPFLDRNATRLLYHYPEITRRDTHPICIERQGMAALTVGADQLYKPVEHHPVVRFLIVVVAAVPVFQIVVIMEQ